MRESSMFRRLMWPRVVKVPMKRGPFFVENGYPLVVDLSSEATEVPAPVSSVDNSCRRGLLEF